MATKKQKQELIDTLKFTPITVRMMIQGYGGESYAGRVDRKDYEFFKKHKYSIDEYAADWDEEWYERVPEEHRFFPAGSPYECDSLWHACGAELTNLNSITVENVSTGETIWDYNLGYSELLDAGVDVEEYGGTDLDDLEDGTVVFWGGQGEKGCFFDIEFELRAPFDPKKLRVCYENCDGWHIVNFIEYDGEELDGTGGYSTTGKWNESKWVIVGDEEVYDAVSMEDRDPDVDYTKFPTEEEINELATLAESEKELDWSPGEELEKIWNDAKTDWFDKEVKPVRNGTYEVVYDAVWPNSGMGMAEWTGRSWKQNGKKLAIKQWRGLAFDPTVDQK